MNGNGTVVQGILPAGSLTQNPSPSRSPPPVGRIGDAVKILHAVGGKPAHEDRPQRPDGTANVIDLTLERLGREDRRAHSVGDLGESRRCVAECRPLVDDRQVGGRRAAGRVLLAPLRVAPTDDVIPACAPNGESVGRPDDREVTLVVARALKRIQLGAVDGRVDRVYQPAYHRRLAIPRCRWRSCKRCRAVAVRTGGASA